MSRMVLFEQEVRAPFADVPLAIAGPVVNVNKSKGVQGNMRIDQYVDEIAATGATIECCHTISERPFAKIYNRAHPSAMLWRFKLPADPDWSYMFLWLEARA